MLYNEKANDESFGLFTKFAKSRVNDNKYMKLIHTCATISWNCTLLVRISHLGSSLLAQRCNK